MASFSNHNASDSPQSGQGQSVQHKMLVRVLTALARILLRHNIGFQTFVDIAKKAFVEVATREHGLRSRPASKARVALLTGINRREVARIQSQSVHESADALFNPVFKVVSHWIREPEFLHANGKPKELPLSGGKISVDELRKRCCPDVPTTAVVRELILGGVAEYASESKASLNLKVKGYVPHKDASRKMELMGVDVAALLNTIDGNIVDRESALFHRKVSFDDLSVEGVAFLNAAAGVDGQAWLENLDEELKSQRSSDAGQFGGMGIYVFSARRPSQQQQDAAMAQYKKKLNEQ